MQVQNRKAYRYEEIAHHISTGIEDGTISPGDKLPSLRIMSRRYGCAVSVVMQAYELLERQGRSYAVEKSGYFARLPDTSPPPLPQNEKHYLQSEEAKPLSIISRIVEAGNDKSVVPLGAGLPHESLLPIKHLKQIFSRTMKEEEHLLSEYSAEAGHKALRSEIARIMLARGVPLNPDEILITNGCTEALALAVQSCSSPGDVIVIESPVFLGIIQILDQLKRRIIPVPTSPEKGMDLNQLEAVFKKEDVKAVIMTALHQNPLGFVMPESERACAVRLAREYGIPLIEDDIYNPCSYSHKEERPLKSFDSEGHVLYCSSFSKTLSPGMRIGWLAGGKKHDVCRRLKMGLTLGGDPFNQQVVAEYLKSPRYDSGIRKLQKALSLQADEIRQLIIRSFPEGTAVTKPEGGFYLWVEIPGRPDCRALFEEALKQGISTVPGSAFGTGGRFSNCLRISVASPVTDDIRQGIIVLGQMLKDQISP